MFDAYTKWLGIRDPERPPNHYRLLGLESYESDPEIIANAADRQMAHVRSFQNGPQAEMARQLISEITAARNCLLNSDSRSEYEQWVRFRAGGTREPQISTVEPELEVVPTAADSKTTHSDFELDVAGRRDDRASWNRSRRTNARRAKPGNRWLIDLIGWIGGGIAALGLGYYLINSKFVEDWRAKRNVPFVNPSNREPVKSADTPPFADEDADSKKDDRNHEVGPKTNSRSQSNDAVPSPNQRNAGSAKNNRPPQPELTGGGKKNSTTADVPPKNLNKPLSSAPSKSIPPEERAAVNPARWPLPTADDRQASEQKFRELFRQALQDESRDGKQRLAIELLRQSNAAADASLVYVMLDESSRLAASIGDAPSVVSAIKEKNRRFEIDFWEEINKPIEIASKNAVSIMHQENLLAAIADIAQLAVDQQMFEVAARFTAKASSAAKTIGDPQYARILDRYRDELADIAKLEKRLPAARNQLNADPDNKSSHLLLGRYWCFAQGDWARGLPHLAKGNDLKVANAAALDLAHLSSQKDSTPPTIQQLLGIADSWFNTGTAATSFERRGMLKRALEFYDAAREQFAVATDANLDRKISQIQFELYVFKEYIDSDATVASNTWNFAVDGRLNYDRARLENGGRTLVLYRGTAVRNLPVSRKLGTYNARTQDGKSEFRIRLLSNDRLELRQVDTASGQIVATLYGVKEQRE
jgi:hypothetical protein